MSWDENVWMDEANPRRVCCSIDAYLYKARALSLVDYYDQAIDALHSGLNFDLTDRRLLQELRTLKAKKGKRVRSPPGLSLRLLCGTHT